jgi:tetratricopeptide (TPR) repeat protein
MSETSPENTTPTPDDAEQLEIKLPGEAVLPKDLALWAGVLALLALTAFWQSTGGSFLWRDDIIAVNPQFAPPGALSRIWLLRWDLPGEFRQSVYQPVAQTAFWLESQLGGRNSQGIASPMPYHIASLVFVALSAIVLWLLLREMKIPGSWLIAGIFALHPLHAEPASWIAEQPIVLAGLFFFAAIWTYLLFTIWLDQDKADRLAGKPGLDPAQTWGFFAGSIALCVMAMLTHPAATVLPAVILLLLWSRRRLHTLDQTVLGVLLLVGAGLWLKNTDLHHAGDAPGLLQSGVVAQLSAIGQSMAMSTIRLIAPIWLSIIYGDSPAELVAVVLCAAALAGAFFFERKFGRGVIAALAAFALLSAASVNWFDDSRLSHVTDCSAYLPMLPILMLIVAAFARVIERSKPRGPNLVVGVSTAVLLLVGVPSWVRTHVFQSPVTLWQDTVNRHPDSVLAESSLAQALRGQARLDAAAENKDAVESDYNQAVDHAQAALKLDPHNAAAEEIWAEVLVDRGQDAQALPHFAAAVAGDPKNARVLTEYGSALVVLARFQEAIGILNRSLAQDYSLGVTHRLLGQAYLGRKDYERTIKEERLAVETDPADTAAWEVMGDAQVKLNQLKDAIESYARVNADGSLVRPELCMKMGRVKDLQGDYEKAVAYMTLAQQLVPDDTAIKAELDAEKIKQQKAAATRPSTRNTTAPSTGPIGSANLSGVTR